MLSDKLAAEWLAQTGEQCALQGVTGRVAYGTARAGHGIAVEIRGTQRRDENGDLLLALDTDSNAPNTADTANTANHCVSGVLDVHGGALWGAIPGGSIVRNMFLPLTIDFQLNQNKSQNNDDEFQATVVLAGQKLSHKTLNETLDKLIARGDPSFAFELRIGNSKELIGFVAASASTIRNSLACSPAHPAVEQCDGRCAALSCSATEPALLAEPKHAIAVKPQKDTSILFGIIVKKWLQLGRVTDWALGRCFRAEPSPINKIGTPRVRANPNPNPINKIGTPTAAEHLKTKVLPAVLFYGMLLSLSYGHYHVDQIVTAKMEGWCNMHPAVTPYPWQLLKYGVLPYFRYLTLLAFPAFKDLHASVKVSYAYTLPQLWMMLSSIPSADNAAAAVATVASSWYTSNRLLVPLLNRTTFNITKDVISGAGGTTLGWLTGVKPNWFGNAANGIIQCVAPTAAWTLGSALGTMYAAASTVGQLASMLVPTSLSSSFLSENAAILVAAATIPFRFDYMWATYVGSGASFATLVQLDTAAHLVRGGWRFGSKWAWGAIGMVTTLATSAAHLAVASFPSTMSQLIVRGSIEPTASLLQRCLSYMPPVSEMLLAAGTHYSLGVTVVLSVAAGTGVISLASIVNRFSSGRIRKVLKAFYKPVLRTVTFGYGVLLCAHSQFHTVVEDGSVGVAAVQYAVGSVLVVLAIPRFNDNVCEKILIVSNGAAWTHGFCTLATAAAAAAAAAAGAAAAAAGDIAGGDGTFADVSSSGIVHTSNVMLLNATDAQVAVKLAGLTGFVTLVGLDLALGGLGLHRLLTRGAIILAEVIQEVLCAVKSVFEALQRGFTHVERAVCSLWKSMFTIVVTNTLDVYVIGPIVDGSAVVAGAIYNGEARLESFAINVIIIPIIQATINAVIWLKDCVVVPTFKFVWSTMKSMWQNICAGLRFCCDTVLIPAWNLGIRAGRAVYNAMAAACRFSRDKIIIPAWSLACRIANAVWNAVCAGYRFCRDKIIIPAWSLACRIANAVWNAVCAAWNAVCAAFRFIYDSFIDNVVIPTWNFVCKTADTLWNLFFDIILIPGQRMCIQAMRYIWNKIIIAAARWTRDCVVIPALEWTVWMAKKTFRIVTSNASFAAFIGFCASSFAKAAMLMIIDGAFDATFATTTGAIRFCMLSYAAWSLCPLSLCLAGRAIRDFNLYNPVFKVSRHVDNFGFIVERFATYWFTHLDLGIIRVVYRIARKAATTTISVFEKLVLLLKEGLVAVFKAALNVVEAIRDVARYLGTQLFDIVSLIWNNPYLGLASSLAVGAAVYQLHAQGQLDALLQLGPEYANKSWTFTQWAAHFVGDVSVAFLHKLHSGANSILVPLTGVTIDAATSSLTALESSLMTITVDPLGMLASKELAGAVIVITTTMSLVFAQQTSLGDADVNAMSQFAVGTAIGLAKPILFIFVVGSGFCWGYVTVYTVLWWTASSVYVLNTNIRSRRDWTNIHQAIKHPKTLQAVMWQITPTKTWGWDQDNAIHLIARNNFSSPDICGDMLVQSDHNRNRIGWLDALEVGNHLGMTPLQVARAVNNTQFVRWVTIVPQLETFWHPGMHSICRPRQQLVVYRIMMIANRIDELEYQQLDESPSDLLAALDSNGGSEGRGGSGGNDSMRTNKGAGKSWGLISKVSKAINQRSKREPLPALPNEIWLQILEFVRCSELGKQEVQKWM